MTELETMLVALRESQRVPTKREAGRILAEGGWAVFPLPDMAKFDNGLSYLNSTTDPEKWDELCVWQMARSECRDVNIALAPGKCAVPLIVVDLDGYDAIVRFWDDAVKAGHIDVGLWLRVNTTRPDHGRHVYFVAPDGKQWSNSTHIWGGDVRSGRGHVVMPPSTTGHGRYTWVGEKLYSAPEWVVNGLRGNTVTRDAGTGEMSDAAIEKMLQDVSKWPASPYGRKALDNMLADLNDARAGDQAGGRNPLLSRTINRVLDLALTQDLNALESINEVADVYETLFSPDEARNPLGEVIRCVRSWVRNHENASAEAKASADALSWAMSRGNGEAWETGTAVESIMDKDDGSPGGSGAGSAVPRISSRVRRRAGRNNWKDSINK